MTAPELAAIRAEIVECRKRADLALGRALQLLDLLELDAREQQRNERLSTAERGTLGAAG